MQTHLNPNGANDVSEQTQVEQKTTVEPASDEPKSEPNPLDSIFEIAKYTQSDQYAGVIESGDHVFSAAIKGEKVYFYLNRNEREPYSLRAQLDEALEFANNIQAAISRQREIEEKKRVINGIIAERVLGWKKLDADHWEATSLDGFNGVVTNLGFIDDASDDSYLLRHIFENWNVGQLQKFEAELNRMWWIRSVKDDGRQRFLQKFSLVYYRPGDYSIASLSVLEGRSLSDPAVEPRANIQGFDDDMPF